MKKKRLLASMAATVVAMSSFAAMNFVANAEEATETPTEVATEATTEATTEAPTAATTEEPTQVITEDPTENPTEDPLEDGWAIVDGWLDFGTWTGSGDFTGTINLSDFEAAFEVKFGEFKKLTNLSLDDGEVESEYYSIVQTDKDIKFTLSEAYMNYLADIAAYYNEDIDYFFEMDFEHGSLSAAFVVTVLGAEPESAETTSNADQNDETATTAVAKKEASPKTGTNGIGFVVGGLSVAGATAFVLKKKK